MDLINMDLNHYVWALVHSKEPEDVQYGIDNLESVLGDYVDEGEECVHLYMLAVGYFRKGDYKKSKGFVDSCLMIEPEWEEPKILKKFVECRLKKGRWGDWHCCTSCCCDSYSCCSCWPMEKQATISQPDVKRATYVGFKGLNLFPTRVMRRPRFGALNRIFLILKTCTSLCRLVIHATYNTIIKKDRANYTFRPLCLYQIATDSL
ncbi:putative mitochondria fission 1 protein [Helianthus anomalus]